MAQLNAPRLESIDALMDWFLDKPSQFVYWSVYRDFQDKKKIGNRIDYNHTPLIQDESWNKLERAIMNQSSRGGRFTVFLTDAIKSQVGITTFIELAPSVGAYHNQYMPATPQQVNAVGAVPNQYGFPQVGMNPQMMEMMFDKKLADARADWEKDLTIEGLQNALEHKENPTLKDKAINTLMQNPLEFLDKAIQGLQVLAQMGNTQVQVQGQTPTSTHTVNGQPNNTPTSPNPKPNENNDNIESVDVAGVQAISLSPEEKTAYDLAINNSLDTIEAQGIRSDQLLTLIAKLVKENPQLVATWVEDESKLFNLINMMKNLNMG